MSNEKLIEIASRIAAGIVAGRPLNETEQLRITQITRTARYAVELAREIEKEANKSA